MRRLLILSYLFCLLLLTQNVNAAPNTITQTELDLKLELQKKDIDANKEQTAEIKAYIKEELNKQKEYNIDSRKYISDKAEKMNWLMNFYSILVTIFGIFMALFAVYSTWKINKSEKDIKESINNTDKAVNKFEEKMKEDLEAVSVIKIEIEEIELKVNECLKKIKGNADWSDELVNRLRENSKKQSLDPIDNKENQEDKVITDYVVDINKSKTESELTANDWLLKGYDAYQNNDFESVCYYYKRSSQLGGNSANLYNLWGNALSKLAIQKSDAVLYNAAISKYEKAIDLDSNYKEAYNNWGNVLFYLAKQKNDAALYNAAISKYEKAIDLDSNYKDAYSNWGNALTQLSVLQGTLGQNKQKIEELLLKSVSLEEGCGSYNLACLYSLLNEKEKAFDWLEKNLNNNEYKQSRETIENDKDFDLIKEDPRFIGLLDRYYPQ